MPSPIDLSSKRSKLALRFFTYGVMTVSTVVLTALLIMVTLGYQFNRTNLSFRQGGLVQLRSAPADASVIINRQAQSFTTPGKINLEAGTHSVTMRREGYHDWGKQFNLAAGQLVWLNYARLVPQNLKTDEVRRLDAAHDAVASPNRRWFLVQPKPGEPSFVLTDYDNREQPKFTTINLPESQLSKQDGAYGVFKIVEWDLDSRFVLVQHTLAGGATEFIRMDRTKPEEPVNLTRLFGLNIVQAHFAGNNADIVFAKTDSALRRLDVGVTSASGVLAANIRDFVVYGSGHIAFSSDIERTPGDAATKAQQIAIYDQDKIIPVRTVPLDRQVIFDYNEYDDHDYLAIGDAKSSAVDIIRDPTLAGQKDAAAVFAHLDLGAPLQWLNFSGNGRMVMAQNGSKLASYDLEEAKAYNRTLDFGAPITQRLRWLDDYYLWGTAGGNLYIVEFDGANAHRIGPVIEGPSVMLSGDGSRLLSIGQSSDKKVVLQATRLRTSADD